MSEGIAGLKLGMVWSQMYAPGGDRTEHQAGQRSLPFMTLIVLCKASVSSSPFLLPSSVSELHSLGDQLNVQKLLEAMGTQVFIGKYKKAQPGTGIRHRHKLLNFFTSQNPACGL